MARKMRRAAVPTARSLPGDGTTRRQALEALLRERPGAPDPPRAAGTASADPTDAAQDREQERLWLAILDRTRDLQAKKDEAQARLAAGRYGVCAGCAEPIPVARLRALPFAVRCLPCQERTERATGTRNGAVRRARTVAEAVARPGPEEGPWTSSSDSWRRRVHP